jgi:hypothetical protein
VASRVPWAIPDVSTDPRAGAGGPRAVLVALACAAAPGVLAGIELAGLLFFLNPHLPFEPGVVARAFAFEGLRLGFASLVLHLPWIWGRWWRARRVLPWTLTLVLVCSAVAAWVHASVFSYYLPAGINRRLLKAAVGLSAAAVVAFYTALVRQLRPATRRQGRWLLYLATGAAVIVTLERREAFRIEATPSPRPSAFEALSPPRMVVIALPSATLDAILPLAEQGRLPFFSRILETGAWGRLSTLEPTRPVAAWATLASGRQPFRHGIVGERSYPASFSSERLRLLPLGLEPYWRLRGPPFAVRGDDKRALFAWEMLTRLDRRTAVIGWPLTDPPPRGVDVVLSESFFAGTGPAVPDDLAERARWFRTEGSELDPALAARFGAEAPGSILTALAEDLWRQELSFFLLERAPRLDALFLYLPGLESVSRTQFGGFSAVQFEGSQSADALDAAGRLGAYYGQLDHYLAQVWARLPSPRWLVVTSAYGTREPGFWKRGRSWIGRRTALSGEVGQGSDGILLLLGEEIAKEASLRPAHLVDLLPTLLYGLGLPIGKDLDGVVLTGAFESAFLARQPLSFLPSYESLALQEEP